MKYTPSLKNFWTLLHWHQRKSVQKLLTGIVYNIEDSQWCYLRDSLGDGTSEAPTEQLGRNNEHSLARVCWAGLTQHIWEVVQHHGLQHLIAVE